MEQKITQTCKSCYANRKQENIIKHSNVYFLFKKAMMVKIESGQAKKIAPTSWVHAPYHLLFLQLQAVFLVESNIHLLLK